MLNADVNWESFAIAQYKEVNYAKLGEDDQQILELTRDFFANAGFVGGSGLDVGCGPNLYPSMAQLPFCHDITLIDYCHGNVGWMSGQIECPDSSWDPFWAVLQANASYTDISDFRSLLKAKAQVKFDNVLSLEPTRYNIGTMFFVAESFTGEWWEFELAVEKFVDSLRPNAPFAMAFMTGSNGYAVGVQKFPAVNVSRRELETYLAKVVHQPKVYDIGLRNPPLREGYSGMALATGWSKS
jgi:hypothetical protein